MSLRNLTVETTLTALTAVGGLCFSPAAHADGSPGNGGVSC